MRIARASSPPSGCSCSPKRTNTGPPNGWRSTTSRRSPNVDPVLGQVAQHLRVGVRHAHEPPRGTHRQLVEAARLALIDLKLGSRDRIAVRVDRRVAQTRGDQRLELLGEHVLEHLGLGMRPDPTASRAPGRETARARGGGAAPQAPHAAPARSTAHRDSGSCSTIPTSVSLRTIPDTDAGRHPEPTRKIGRRHRRTATSLERIHSLRVVLHRCRKQIQRSHN